MKRTTLLIGLTLAVAGTANGQCIQGDINGDGIVNGIDLAYVLQNWGQSCPTVIHAVSPPSGLPAGGTAITITGEQLGGVLGVTIGGAPATNVVGVNATTVTAITPPSKTLGASDVVVTTTSGSATLVGGFQYSPLAWATVLDFQPDPTVISSVEWRERIIATGLPWRVRDLGTGIELLLIPPGTFMMGCSPSLQFGCEADENPAHDVTLTQAFYLGRFEVTQAQWTTVMGSNPSEFQGLPDSQSRPVERVSWNMIQGFEAATGLRLPTEAEWEYACRAGTGTAFNLPPQGSNTDVVINDLAWWGACCGGNSGGQTHPVGEKMSNNLGIHDAYGNVWEWVEDWYGSSYYSQSPATDPPGPLGGSRRIVRGGSWFDSTNHCRSSDRLDHAPGFTGYVSNVGFRVARTP